MGLKIENVLSGFVLFSVLVSLLLGIYSSIASEYEITPDYVDEEGNSIIQALEDINVISGLSEVQTAIKAFYEADTGSGSEYDILGNLKAGAIGAVKLGTGVITAPLEIIGVITGFYTIPSSVSVGLGLIIVIYIGYMLLAELLGK